MTTGGTLHVMSQNTYDAGFSVKFARNTVITNYSGREMSQTGDICAQIKNGREGVTKRVYSSGLSGDLATMDLSTKRLKIFDELRKLDGNASDVSEKDLAMAKSLIGKNGVTNVRMDAKAGVTTIVCDDGAVLKFDVETDAEKQVREKNEAAADAKKKEAQQTARQKKEQEKAQLHEECKSTLENFGDKIGEFFVDFVNWIKGE